MSITAAEIGNNYKIYMREFKALFLKSVKEMLNTSMDNVFFPIIIAL